ncbi:MAG: hypothetical protein ACRDRI_11460 [Pseudonocardiaceae bacterium]
MLHLSHGVVGAAERKVMEAEPALRVNGADSPEIIPAIEEAYAVANAQSRLDVLAHVQWRATQLVQVLQALTNDLGRQDEVLSTAMMAAPTPSKSTGTSACPLKPGAGTVKPPWPPTSTLALTRCDSPFSAPPPPGLFTRSRPRRSVWPSDGERSLARDIGSVAGLPQRPPRPAQPLAHRTPVRELTHRARIELLIA